MMMSLGLFLFTLPTIVYQQLEHRRDVRFAQNPRLGRPDAWQFVGPGEEAILLTGVTAYRVTNASASSAILNRMMQTGKPWPLIDGLGNMFGEYVILNFDRKSSVYRKFGQAQKMEWSLELQRTDDPGGAIGNIVIDGLLDAVGAPVKDAGQLIDDGLSVFGKGLGI